MSTFIGKILVLVIMVFSLLFLAISTVEFATSKNWQTAFAADQKKVDELKKKLQVVSQDVEAAKKGLEEAKANLAAETKNLTKRIAAIDEENKRDSEKIVSVRDQLVTAQQSARATLAEVQAKRRQIDALHEQQAAVLKQANAFKAHQSELNDRIHELERMIEAAAKNYTDLRKPVQKVSALVR